ncbi:hypothetical protein DXA97_19140 [Clostridium sp. OF09-36]|nr:hypothetical protein DXA97_19140 [Clostridium sp. OF09-36]
MPYEILLQHVSIVPCLCVFGISHFGLYYLYSSNIENQKSYKEAWDENLRSDDPLLKYKTKLLMRTAAAGPIRGFDSELMRIVMDIITVHEDGRLQIRFYDGTEFELAAE